MLEKLIVNEADGNKFSAFITTNKPDCQSGGEHQWDGDEILRFHNDDRVLTRTQLDALPEIEKERLNPASGECSCSKCGIGYMSYDNPFFSEI
jgi:hypothetical protein